ncbi:nucleic acid/nucleotide deaminase domain-containing protein [Aspergillus stella-maris]|uniref:nucleic acid/nucleotide deaminase domain-containing protein n=1 Tax=Aspergillus stella-maris TaxID=1810926 RepID=UPI003CCD2EB7
MSSSCSPPSLRQIQTASPCKTIWSHVSQDAFRQHLVTLEKQTNAVPMDVLQSTKPEDECKGDGNENYKKNDAFLPLKVEKQFADDFAYIAAVTEGAQSVAAVCLEQYIDTSNCPYTLIIRVAGMDAIDENVRALLQTVVTQLQCPAQEPNSTETIFRSIIAQHTQKLLGRLRSRKWNKPKHLARTHKKALWQDFENLLHRAQHVYARKPERRVRDAIETSIREIRKVYEEFEKDFSDSDGGQADDQLEALQNLVKASYTWCKEPLIGEYASKLEILGGDNPTRQVAAATKTLRQLEKIGAYWRIASDLVAVAAKYKHIFQRTHIEYLTPFASTPTNIAYESWAQTCHVHAEIQLVVELAKSIPPNNQSGKTEMCRPRTIGTSKYLCYLCYLFLHYHGGFQMLSTHGRLYDQWTVPDLIEYDAATRDKFSTVLERMDEHIIEQIKETEGIIWRAEPMTSRQNLLLPDDVHTLDTGAGGLALS